mgnify:CR=1 FL=1
MVSSLMRKMFGAEKYVLFKWSSSVYSLHLFLVTGHYEELRLVLTRTEAGLSDLKRTTLTTLRLLADSRYMEGILGIEAAFETFMELGPGAQDIEQKIEEFQCHKFELERDYRLHLSQNKGQSFRSLRLLRNKDIISGHFLVSTDKLWKRNKPFI